MAPVEEIKEAFRSLTPEDFATVFTACSSERCRRIREAEKAPPRGEPRKIEMVAVVRLEDLQ